MNALLLAWALCGPVMAGPAEMLEEANMAYVDGDFEEAGRIWEALIEAGHPTGDLYYNLGNALYRQSEPALAMLAWRRARLLSPRDGDIEANLDRARRQLKDRLEPDPSPGLFFWQAMLSTSEQGWLAATLFGVLGLLGIAGRLRKEWHLALPAALIAVPAVLLVASTFDALGAPLGGVLLAPEVEVRSAGGAGAGVVLFTLHAGAEVTCGETLGSWLLVSLPDGRKGWVPSRAVGRVDPAVALPAPWRETTG